jgi:hypothetical protein
LVTETTFQPQALAELLDLWRRAMPQDAPDLARFRDLALLNVIPVPPYPINIALPLAGGWAVVGIVTTVYLVRTGRTGWLNRATQVFGETIEASEISGASGNNNGAGEVTPPAGQA